MTPGDPSLRGRFRGCLLGVAVGDALGAPYEGSPRVSARELDELQRRRDLRYTDDTHMTIGVAGSLVERGGFDGSHMAARLADNFDAEPWRGYGSGPPQVFRLLRAGAPWDRAARTLFRGAGSYGNGAAMRIAPIALFAHPDLDEVAELARHAARITHTHDLGVDGAVLQATAIAWLLARPPGEPFDDADLLSELGGRVGSAVFREKLEDVARLASEGSREEVVASLGHGIEAAASVPTALLAFLRNRDAFAPTIRYAISLGGDTDTIASMAGALAGAHLGEDAIPEPWREGIEDAGRLRGLADALLRTAGAARGSG